MSHSQLNANLKPLDNITHPSQASDDAFSSCIYTAYNCNPQPLNIDPPIANSSSHFPPSDNQTFCFDGCCDAVHFTDSFQQTMHRPALSAPMAQAASITGSLERNTYTETPTTDIEVTSHPPPPSLPRKPRRTGKRVKPCGHCQSKKIRVSVLIAKSMIANSNFPANFSAKEAPETPMRARHASRRINLAHRMFSADCSFNRHVPEERLR
jgi:hypothetical protein